MTSKLLHICAICLCLGASLDKVCSEEAKPPAEGFIRLFNAVSQGTGKLDCCVDGVSVREEGYQLGDVTGGIALAAKSHLVEIRREGLKKAEIKVTLVADQTVILVFFETWVPATDTTQARWKIGVLPLHPIRSELDGKLTLITVSKLPGLILGISQGKRSWKSQPLDRLATVRHAVVQQQGDLVVQAAGREFGSISVVAASQTIAVIYDDLEGKIQMKSFIDYPYTGGE
jgi:hypothetical protein